MEILIGSISYFAVNMYSYLHGSFTQTCLIVDPVTDIENKETYRVAHSGKGV